MLIQGNLLCEKNFLVKSGKSLEFQEILTLIKYIKGFIAFLLENYKFLKKFTSSSEIPFYGLLDIP